MRRSSCALVTAFLLSCAEEAPPAPLPFESPPSAEVDAAAPPIVVESDAAAEAAAPVPQPDAAAACATGMVRIDAFCIDRYEAYVVEVDKATGAEKAHSPFVTVEGLTLRAKVSPDVTPQAYISQLQAEKACLNAGKRLCKMEEFSRACRGPDATNLYPYGGAKKLAGYCNEGKGSSVAKYFGSDSSKWTYENFNDPKLNQWAGGLARGGEYKRCVSPEGVYDLVGNLHEWGDDPADARGRGRFRGGFYGDAEVNGHGCDYVTKAHELSYHDYSTGFRCCADSL